MSSTPTFIKSMTKTEEETVMPEEVQGSLMEEIAIRIIDELLSSQTNLKMKSDLSNKQITAVTKAYVYAAHYNSPLVRNVADTLLELLVSKNRLGRKELTDLARSLSDYSSGIGGAPSRMDILTGKGL
jgi:DNA gyrase/topoisomerase IV subunit B